MKKIIKIIIFSLALIFIGFIISGLLEITAQNSRLKNKSFYIHGRILSINASSNHSFGIYTIAIDSQFIKYELGSKDTIGLMPFKTNSNKNLAEIYTNVSLDDSINFTLTLDGKSGYIYIKDREGNVVSDRLLNKIYESPDRKFVSKNTKM